MATAQEYYSAVYSAAKEMGANDVQAHLAASQSSLETGYGKSVVGNNHFGIKAGSKYTGPTVKAATKEEVGGKLVGITDSFRSYQNLKDSVRGYMEFMAERFPQAWNAATFESATKGLNAGKKGGYATDSQYENKLSAISENYAGNVSANQQAQAASYDPTSLQLGFMADLVPQSMRSAAPVTGQAKEVQAAQPSAAPVAYDENPPLPDMPLVAPNSPPSLQNEEFIPGQLPDNAREARLSDIIGLGKDFASRPAEALPPNMANPNLPRDIDGKLQSQSQYDAARFTPVPNFATDRPAGPFTAVPQTASAVKGYTSPNRSDVPSLPDDLGPSRQVSVREDMNPLTSSLDGASRLTRSYAVDNMRDVLSQKHDMARQHYEMMTGKPMPPIADAIAKAGTTREKDTRGSQHFHGTALDYSTAEEELGYKMSQFERSALKEAFKIAGLPTVNFYADGRRVHADTRPGGGFWSGSRYQPPALGTNVTAYGAPIPTPAPRGGMPSQVDRASISTALSGPFGGVNFANGQSAGPQNITPSFSPSAASMYQAAQKSGYQDYGASRSSTPAPIASAPFGAASSAYGGIGTPPQQSRQQPSATSLGYTSPTNYASRNAKSNEVQSRASSNLGFSKPTSYAGPVSTYEGKMPATAAQYAAYGAGKPISDPLAIATSTVLSRPEQKYTTQPQTTALDEQLAEEERISRPKVAKDLARVERFNPNRKSVANVLTNAVVRTPAYQLFAALTGKPTDAKAGGLLGSLMGGLSGVAGGLGAPIGSNYTGGWTPAAGGNQVSASPIGVGVGGESLRGVQNQYGATSMLGEGGSRTYGGPGGSSGK